MSLPDERTRNFSGEGVQTPAPPPQIPSHLVRQSENETIRLLVHNRRRSENPGYAHIYRRRSSLNSRGRMASAEGGSVPSGVGYGEGCSLSSRLGGLGERRELPQRGPGHSARPKTNFGVFWRPQNAPSCIYMTKDLRGQFALASPLLQILGDLSTVPRDLRPCLCWYLTVWLLKLTIVTSPSYTHQVWSSPGSWPWSFTF